VESFDFDRFFGSVQESGYFGVVQQMNSPFLILFIALVLWTHHVVQAQDGSKRRRPLLVSHLSAENNALLRRPAAPKHNIFTRLICFKVPCTKYIGARQRQRRMRFKGYKDGGKVPRPPKEPVIQNHPLVVARDTTVVKVVPPSPVGDTSATKDRIFVLDEVLFELNSARFNVKFIFRLDSLTQLLASHESLRADISGHTDNTGSVSYNLKLSNDRAAAVADYLIRNNISRDRISYAGVGSARPIADNKTDEGRRKNRRVEIRLSE
jgi:outer membrane protein OmpA-like peptidoglycan-associated protein